MQINRGEVSVREEREEVGEWIGKRNEGHTLSRCVTESMGTHVAELCDSFGC